MPTVVPFYMYSVWGSACGVHVLTVARVSMCRSYKAGAMRSDFSESALLFPKEGYD